MSSSRRLLSEQAFNQDTPMYPLPFTSQSFDTSNQLRVDAGDARHRRHNHQTQPASHRNVSDMDIIDMDIAYTLYGEIQAADLFAFPNGTRCDMNFQR
jgi:hypothetical protein